MMSAAVEVEAKIATPRLTIETPVCPKSFIMCTKFDDVKRMASGIAEFNYNPSKYIFKRTFRVLLRRLSKFHIGVF